MNAEQRERTTTNESLRRTNIHFVLLLLIELYIITGCVILFLTECFRELTVSISLFLVFCIPERFFFAPRSTSDLDVYTPLLSICNPVSLTMMHVYIFWLFCSSNKAQITHTGYKTNGKFTYAGI